MAELQPRPVLITGGGRRIGLALAHHFLQQHQPVIVSYRTPYPAIDDLRQAGALCLQADFSSDDGILTFAEAVKSHTSGLRAIIHNASDWMAEKPGVPLSTVINRMMQIHVHAPYLLNHALEELLRGHGHAASDIIHITDYVVERDEAYRQQALDKSLMKIAPGEKEISDLIDYLFTSRYVTGRSYAVDGGRPLR